MQKLCRSLFALCLIAALVLPVAAQSDRTVTIARSSEPDNLNPMYTTALASVIYNPLWLPGVWTYNEALEVEPILVTEIPSAENGGISEDGLTITLRLRDDLAWSDGAPLTSADFRFTMDMLLDEANVSVVTSPYDGIASLETPDEHTVIVTFAEPHVTWVNDLFPWALPAHVLQPVYDEEGSLQGAAWNRLPSVAYGPYVATESVGGSFILFEANANWWGGEPGLDSILVQFIDDANATKVAMLQGEVDISNNFNNVDLGELEEAGFTLQQQPSKFQSGLFFNLRLDESGAGHPGLQEQAVRLAIALGSDRDAINIGINEGLVQTPASFWGMIPAVVADDAIGYPYDPEAARQALDDAGWIDSNGDGARDKDGIELSLRYVTSTGDINSNIQAVIQQQLAEIGIGVQLVNMPPDQLFDLDNGPLTTGDFDLIMFGDGPSYPDPYIPYFLCDEVVSPDNPYGWNASGFCDEELDALFIASQSAIDTAERTAIFQEITSIFQAEVYWVGISEDPASYLVSPRVEGFQLGGASPFWNASEWRLAG